MASSRDPPFDEEYSEIEYSDMDGEDDMMFDSPPYYNYEDHHHHHPNHHPQHQHYHTQSQQLDQHLQQQNQQHAARSLHFPVKPSSSSSSSCDIPAGPSSTSSSRHGRERDQEQVEEALRASLSTLLATGPRPKFKQRRNRPRKIYTVDTRSQRSSPLVPASPTHLYYSTTASPHLVPSNPDNLGDLSPVYFHGTLSPYTRDYDSASSDSEQARQKNAFPRGRGILSTGGGESLSYNLHAHDNYYEIESSTLNSNDPPFSGSTTPYSPLKTNTNTKSNISGHVPAGQVTATVLQGPSSLLAARYVSWSVKAQSILDHVSKDMTGVDDRSSVSTSASSSPHSSPSASGASTPSRIRRKRCSIPEPHQGFFSRALDQRSLASHVSVSRVGMAGTNCSPLQLTLRAGTMIRGSSPLKPSSATNVPSGTTPTSYPFSRVNRDVGVLRSKEGNNTKEPISCQRSGGGEQGGSTGTEDKENKRWYGQEIGLHLWQTTLGAAVLLGTGFGTGSMVKKVSSQQIQLHPKELTRSNQESDFGSTTIEDSEGSTLLDTDAEVPSLSHTSTLEDSLASLRNKFQSTHPLSEKIKRRLAQTYVGTI
ncbi:hypothetical protein BG004_008393 [Podila humilis]|nr:hypothetical protein BG004_008393 [Podila humilis]